MTDNLKPAPKRARRAKIVYDKQLIAVPLGDGTHGALHVADGSDRNDLVLVLHAARSSQPEALLDQVSWDTAIWKLNTGSTPIDEGPWVLLGEVHLEYRVPIVRGKTWSAYKLIEHHLEAYYGLFPWDGMADPKYFEKTLFSHVKRPPSGVRFKGDFDLSGYTYTLRGSAAPVKPAEPPASAVTGPAEVEVHVLYPAGAGLETMRALEQALSELRLGEIDAVETGEEDGTIVLCVEAVELAVPRIEKGAAPLRRAEAREI